MQSLLGTLAVFLGGGGGKHVMMSEFAKQSQA